MTELVSIYKWAILAGMLMAPALALIGAQLAARDKAMQTLCVGQGATLGVLLGLGFFKLLDATEAWIAVGPFFTAGLFSVFTFLMTERLVRKRQASKNTVYSSLFASLLALGYLVCVLFPPLESHMSQVFFGDLATLSNSEAFVTSMLGLFALGYIGREWRVVSKDSFHQTVFGKETVHTSFSPAQIFPWLLVVALSFCVQYLGFLFTIACLFLPTTLATRITGRGIRFHFLFSSILAAVSAYGGFLLSLRFTRLPTVPAIVVVMILLGSASVYLLTLSHAVRLVQE